MATKRTRKWTLYFLLAMGIGYGVTTNFMANHFLSLGRYVPVKPADFEDVRISGKRGPIPAWTTTGVERADVVAILVHGYGGSRNQFTKLMHHLSIKGVSSVEIALPGHDANPEPYCGFGMKEVDDVGSTIEWIKEQRKGHPAKILVGGVSLGGSIAWYASQDYRVDGVFVESTFPNFSDAMDEYLNRKFGFFVYALKPAIWLAEHRSGVDPKARSAIAGAKAWRGKPCAVIQSDSDKLFPIKYGQEIADAAGVSLTVIKGAKHANCYGADPKTYERVVDELVDKVRK